MKLEINWPDAGAEAVDEAAARLRRAGRNLRRRPRGEVVDALCELLERWREPGSPLQRELIESLPSATGFSAAVVEEGLRRALAGWSADALRGVIAREIDPIEREGHSLVTGFPTTSVLLAGSIPMPSLLSVLLPLVLRSTVLARPAERDPVTARVVARSIAQVDEELGRCVEVVSFPSEDAAAMRRFLASECVVASGSDETLGQLRPHVSAAQRFVGYGHRLSLAVLGPAATSQRELVRAASGLALDTALWDQLGCLSPVAVFVESEEPKAALRVAAALAEALAEVATRNPRGALPPQVAAAIAAERAEAEVRAAAGHQVVLHGSGADPFSVVCEDTTVWRAAPLHRFVRVHPARDRAALLAALGPLGRHLSAVAVAGFDDADRASLARDLAELGASRICAPGTLQTPPLGWHHDGQPLLLPLARVTNLEPEA